MPGYEQEKAYDPEQRELMNEIHNIHKQVSELDAMVDMYYTKLDCILLPDRPRPAPDDAPAIAMQKSPLREELCATQNRMRTQLERLQALYSRIDL